MRLWIFLLFWANLLSAQVPLSAYYAKELPIHLTDSQSLQLFSPPQLLQGPLDTLLQRPQFAIWQTGDSLSYRSYLVQEAPSQLITVSLFVQPKLLWDDDKGIYSKGPRAWPIFPYKGANFYQKKEVPAQLALIDSSGLLWQGPVGLSIFGGNSRAYEQKSLAIYARSSYGAKWIRYPIFSDLPYKKYKRLILRNSGSGFKGSHLRDAFIGKLGRELGLGVQAYRPARVYINGQYWGILNIREKLTARYLEQHYGVDKDSLDLMEYSLNVNAGSSAHYLRLRKYMQQHNLADSQHYAQVGRWMDVQNFMDYQIMQIYADNQDAGGNIKFWRPKTANGRWQWLLYDTDYGFGFYSKGGYDFNSLKFHTEANGPRWPNPPWSTFLLRQLLKNQGFRQAFLQRFCDRINGHFQAERLCNRLDSMGQVLRPELWRHQLRWQLHHSLWTNRMQEMAEFAHKRPAYMAQFLAEFFPEFGPQQSLVLQTQGDGFVRVNDLYNTEGLAQGLYFQGLGLRLKAQPYLDQRFSHWIINGQRYEGQRLALPPQARDSLYISAVFELAPKRDLIINEFSCRDSLAGDWIEFFNASAQALQLEKYALEDEKGHRYQFAAGELPAGAYLVLCRDSLGFKKRFPDFSGQLWSGLNFGLGAKSDQLLLYAQNELVDSLSYKLGKSKDSLFLSLALRHPYLQRSNFALNWKKERNAGSPGQENPIYSKKRKERSLSKNWKAANFAPYLWGLALFLGLLLAAYGLGQYRGRE